ncbi:MAG: guanylate kinase [Desulfatitalea sp.]|nr:guanylate kinase [Desulfatitalea sp.]
MSHTPTVGSKNGRLFIVSAPSGAGKSTLCAAVRRQFPHLAYSISYTTRAPRRGEQDGRDYFFVSTEAFEAGIAEGRWAEWARVHGNLYGTAAQWIADTLAAGRDILMDIDVQGTRQILERFPEAVTIFIQPPSLAVLEQRLRQRGTDDEATIATRLANACQEMASAPLYRHIVVNDDLAQAQRELMDLIHHAGQAD